MSALRRADESVSVASIEADVGLLAAGLAGHLGARASLATAASPSGMAFSYEELCHVCQDILACLIGRACVRDAVSASDDGLALCSFQLVWRIARELGVVSEAITSRIAPPAHRLDRASVLWNLLRDCCVVAGLAQLPCELAVVSTPELRKYTHQYSVADAVKHAEQLMALTEQQIASHAAEGRRARPDTKLVLAGSSSIISGSAVGASASAPSAPSVPDSAPCEVPA